MKLFLRALRLDPSDTFVFERAAQPGEWAVPASFLWDADLDGLAPKQRAAFRSGFLGLDTCGFSTLVEVAEIDEAGLDALIPSFARQLEGRFGAPDPETALAAARSEIAFAASLCEHAPGTVIAMYRTVEGGTIKEQFRTLHRRDATAAGADRLHAYARAFEFVEVDEHEEHVDLLGLRGKE
jgi:hypothetical protein